MHILKKEVYFYAKSGIVILRNLRALAKDDVLHKEAGVEND